MFSAARRRLTYANVAATLALVFAMTGGALAAGKFLITSTKQIKPSVLAQLKGKAGPKGPAGTAGPQGPGGPEGKAGANGKDGSNGSNGVSVTGKALAAGEGGCAAGGIAYTSASGANSVCNGANGQTGFTETLPPGKTETGAWSVSTNSKSVAPSEKVISTIPFAIPLKAALDENHVHYITKEGKELFEAGFESYEEVTSTACLGSAAAPSAKPGNLCVYETLAFGLKVAENSSQVPLASEEPQVSISPIGLPPRFIGSTPAGAGSSGALLQFGSSGEEAGIAYGSWAVTAAEK